MSRPPTGLNLHAMDSESWSRLESILDQILDLPQEQIRFEVERLCAGDRELEAQVLSMVAADRTVEGYLSDAKRDGLIRDLAPIDFGLPSLEGRSLGPWRVLHRIGRGGMGSVYVGERADGAFEQRVAIKFLGRGITPPELLARFRQERQILARLKHPNIAHLVDGGVTEDGLWWFAMEYVEGSPITAWCASHGLDTRATLRLFQQVCRAVHYAHQNLVVHRDLKPGNIFVSDTGDVKLLDFGIAKILAPEHEEDDHSLLTTAGMTPTYAAPEQIRGEPPTTTTDVYALGVILYELLTGERPHSPRTDARDDLRRAVLHDDPDPPSTRVRRIRRERSREENRSRSRDPSHQDIPRELDAIVLTAIRREPERRYSSAEAFSEDIQRFLEGRPVHASGRGFSYLTRTFARRNRLPLTASLLIVLAVSAGFYATARERDRARLEAAKAREIKEFALDLFRVSDPEEGEGLTVTARELLDRGADRVDRELTGDPRLQAEMWDLLGSVYGSLGIFPRAISMYEKAVASRRANPDPPDTLLAQSLRGMGNVLLEVSDHVRAERALVEALAIQRRVYGEVDQQLAMTAGTLAALKRKTGATAEAESLYRYVIRVDTLTVGLDHAATATDLANLGMLYYMENQYRLAVPYIARALEIRRRVLGPEHVQTATGMDQLGIALTGAGDPDSGLALNRQALAIRRRRYPPDHPDIAHSLASVARALSDMGRYSEAVRHLREALAIRTRSYDARNPVLAHTHNDLAVIFYREGALDSAGVHFQEAVRIWSQSLPPDHPDVLTTRGNLGVVYRELGRYAESERLLRQVLAERLRTTGPDHMNTAGVRYNLGRLLVMVGRAPEGEPLLRQALRTRRANLDADDPRVAEIELALGHGLVAMGRTKEGRELIRRSVGNAEKRLGPKDRFIVLARTRS